MKGGHFVACAVATAASFCGQAYAASFQTSGNQIVLDSLDHAEKFLVETGPGQTQWVTDDEKWALKRKGVNFMDITDYADSAEAVEPAVTVTFPSKPVHNKTITPMLERLNKTNMREHLEVFSSFRTRYYKSETGAESSRWLLQQVNDTVAASGALANRTTVKPFVHPWGQNSIIVTIPGKSNRTVVVGAHQDSTNWLAPLLFAAPGADDDGSGTVTILEALRVLLQSKKIRTGQAENTIEFHWYSAEEGGLLGSQAIFQSYKAAKRDVKAMLQQDMTGYVQGTIDAGKPVSVGVITDFVDAGLSNFIMKIVEEYCDIPYVRTKCGYACSDHASASKAGYPSAYVMEAEFSLSNTGRIHTTNDLIEFLSFDHMLQHAKMTLGLAYELAFADFS